MTEEIEKLDELTDAEALLKILELGKRQVAEGKVHPAEEVFERLRKKHGFSDGRRNPIDEAKSR